MVRERAACSLAESGMLSHEQRLAAVPQLINYSDDPRSMLKLEPGRSRP